MAAQRKLLADTAGAVDERIDRGTAWADFDELPVAVKEKAASRLKALQVAEWTCPAFVPPQVLV